MSLTYAAALDALAERGRFGIRLGLGRTRALLAELGDPQRSIRGALVGGTNGKGSVLALTGSALRAGGFRVGLTPKPHLVSYRERLEIAGRPIDEEAFAALVEEALVAAGRVARRHGPPTEFELLTAAIFCWFEREAVDLAVVEVGLGGRLDATHAWDGGVAAVTNVDLDHTEQLGPTIAAIAREKAPIIERGDWAVTGATGTARAIIRRRAHRVGASLTVVEPAPLLGWDRDGITVDLPGLGPTRVGLRGRHQAANVAVADALLDALASAGIARVGADARRAGYAAATWPGRLELVEAPRPGAGGGRVEVLLDGAHNPAGALALATALADLRPYLAGGAGSRPEPLTLVLGCMADKDVDGLIDGLLGRGAPDGATSGGFGAADRAATRGSAARDRAATADSAAADRAGTAGSAAARGGAAALADARVICTAVDLPRALPAADLAARWAARNLGSRPLVARDPGEALDLALRGAGGTVVVAGSLYLVGAMRRQLVLDGLPPDPAVLAHRLPAATPTDLGGRPRSVPR